MGLIFCNIWCRLNCRQRPLKGLESFTLQLHGETDSFKMLLFTIFFMGISYTTKITHKATTHFDVVRIEYFM